MEKTKKQPKEYEKPVLCIVYFYKPDGDMDCCNFIAEAGNTTKKDFEQQFLDYANKWNEWGIKKDDIDGVYMVSEEEDYLGRKYKVIVPNRVKNQKIEIPFSDEDLDQINAEETFDWTFETDKGQSIDVHLRKENEDDWEK